MNHMYKQNDRFTVDISAYSTSHRLQFVLRYILSNEDYARFCSTVYFGLFKNWRRLGYESKTTVIIRFWNTVSQKHRENATRGRSFSTETLTKTRINKHVLRIYDWMKVPTWEVWILTDTTHCRTSWTQNRAADRYKFAGMRQLKGQFRNAIVRMPKFSTGSVLRGKRERRKESEVVFSRVI